MKQHQRAHRPWTPDNWDNGYIDNRGRFRVYRPDYPGAYDGGYALRAHIVWWLQHGEVCGGNDLELHHRDGNRLNDHPENLIRIPRSDHQVAHRSTARLLYCETCRRGYTIPAWRIRQRQKEGWTPRYCSLACRNKGRVGKRRKHTKPPVTHCVHGHAYTAKNTYWSPTGHRQCRICKNERLRRYRAA